jgi:hypothetical protein
MRTTDFCFPLPDYEHPRLMSYRHLFEVYASPLADGLAPATRRPVDLAFHDAESASVGLVKVDARHHSAGAPDRAVPLTPLSLPVFLPDAFASCRPSGLPRPLPSPLREDETLCSAQGAFHRRGTLTHMRESVPISFAFTCVSTTTEALGAPSPTAPRVLLSRHIKGYRRLDPRPCPSPRFALFTRDADRRFSGSGYRPTTSATDFRRTDTLPSIRSSRFARPAYVRGDVESAFALARLFKAGDLPLSKKDHERREPRQPFRSRPHDAARAAQDETPKAILRSTRRLRATPRSDHRLRRWPLENSAGLHGPRNSERGTFPPPPAAAVRRR